MKPRFTPEAYRSCLPSTEEVLGFMRWLFKKCSRRFSKTDGQTSDRTTDYLEAFRVRRGFFVKETERATQ